MFLFILASFPVMRLQFVQENDLKHEDRRHWHETFRFINNNIEIISGCHNKVLAGTAQKAPQLFRKVSRSADIEL